MTISNIKARGTTQVVSAQPDLDPPGGIDRLHAAGVKISDILVERIRSSRANPTNEVPFYVWPSGIRRKLNSLDLTGRCPFCRFVHDGHGIPLDRTPFPLTRVPRCQHGLPPFADGSRPPQYRLTIVLDVPPEDVAWESRILKGDLFIACKNAMAEFSDKQDEAFARWAILRSGACDERSAILEVQAGLSRVAARRAAVTEFVRKYGTAGMKKRLARATYAAARGHTL